MTRQDWAVHSDSCLEVLPQEYFPKSRGSGHRGFVRAAINILESKEHQDYTAEQFESYIYTGHSKGGAVAALVALSHKLRLHQQGIMHIHVFCITFGVPLIGDALLQDCIHGQFGWGKDFLHIVARHDIVPRILLSKFAGAGSLVKWLGSRLFAIRHETQETRIAIDSQEHDNINLALENVEKEKEALLQEGSARSQPLQTIPSRQKKQKNHTGFWSGFLQ